MMGLYVQEPDCAMTREQYYRLRDKLGRPIDWSPQHQHNQDISSRVKHVKGGTVSLDVLVDGGWDR